MKLRILFCVCYMFMTNIVFCQSNISINSLQKLLFFDKEDTNKVNHLNKLCIEYLKTGSYDTALGYGSTALELANKLNYADGIANSYNNIGVLYRYEGNYDKAMENHFTALKIREKINDKQGMAVSYNNLGIIYNLQDNYEKALEYFFIALKIREEINDKQGLAASYNNIGNVYSNEGKLNSHPDSHNVYQNYEKALENYFASLKIKKEINDKQGMAATYNNIGIIYSIQRNHEKALEYFFLALKIREEISDKQGVATSYNNIANTYTDKLNYANALVWQQKGLHIAKEIGAKDLLISSYQGLSDISEKINDYKNAYKYHQLYSSTKDSIFNEESSKQITEMQTKYETEKKDTEILKQQIQVNQKNYVIYGLLILVIFTIAIGYLFVRHNKLLANQKALELEGRLLRSQLNPHFIFNALAAIKAIIPYKSPDESSEYLTKFSKLMRAILETSKEEYISLEEEVKIITNYLELQSLRFNNKFNYSIEISPLIDAEQILIPPMLTQPFIENALEHGIKNIPEKGCITIRMALVEMTLHIEIEDNGVGFVKTEVPYKKNHKPMAMDITQERLKNLNKIRRQKIEMTVINKGNSASPQSPDFENGTKVIIIIPLS